MTKQKIFAILGLTASAAMVPVSAEVIPGTDISIHFESANIVGSGRHLNMARIPVIDINTGNTTYFDASFKFTLVPNEGLVFEQITSAAVSAPISVANITPGVYRSSSNQYCYKLEGPAALDSNRSVYTFRGVVNAELGCRNSADPFTAQIVSGVATGHPDISERDIVPHLGSDYVYGYIATGSPSTYGLNRGWESNELIGIRQSGQQLIVGLFSEGVDSNGLPTDFARPRETVIMTRVSE
ncbi:MAG: hypothetical protein methR_P2451 [Methyloprofundus sp.]|nr:MAG: hypothetical protein methR_P2451 [Methyloprofundus sp.]